MTSLFHVRDGAVLQGGMVVSVLVPAVLCIVLVQGCLDSLPGVVFQPL